jgi:uncharacterized coiled-coil protein SlyX
MNKENNKLTASQRLEGLEQAFALTDQTLGNLSMNLQTAINALTLLSKKLEAVIRISNAGKQISSASVAEEIIDMNAEELKEKVDDLKKKGIAVDGDVIQENSFIVGRELNPETKVVSNKRMQFPLFGLKQEKKGLLLGKKAGDIVTLEEGRNLLEITEVYNIIVPSMTKKEAAPEASEASTETPTEAPAEATNASGSEG